MNDDKIEASVERIGDLLCDGIDELKAENEALKADLADARMLVAKHELTIEGLRQTEAVAVAHAKTATGLELQWRERAAAARPSKSDAAKLALSTIEDWINRRGVTGIDRARKQLLVEALADVFGAPEVKEAEGIS